MSHLTSYPEGTSIRVTTDAAIIRNIALATWPPTYHGILSEAQITYMLEEIYSLASLQHQMETGQTFLLLTHQGQPAAFAAFSCLEPSQHLFKLNKLYILPSYQGQGYGRLLLQEVIQRAKQQGAQKLELNVHLHNPAQHFYSSQGFTIHKIIDLPFGPFILNDYIMLLNLATPKAG